MVSAAGVAIFVSAIAVDTAPDGLATRNSDLPVWQIDYANSYIKFIGDQAGAEFDGVWETWSASL